MEAKLKAKELVERFRNTGIKDIDLYDISTIRTKIAKQCALIAVDEILDELSDYRCENSDCQQNNGYSIDYWQQVKSEITKL